MDIGGPHIGRVSLTAANLVIIVVLFGDNLLLTETTARSFVGNYVYCSEQNSYKTLAMFTFQYNECFYLDEIYKVASTGIIPRTSQFINFINNCPIIQ